MSDFASTSDSNASGLSDNAAAGIAYITIIPAIVFLIIEPFKRSPFVRFHAWQSIFFFVAWAVVDILIGVVQNIVPSVGFPTYLVMELVGLAIFVIWLIVFIGAFNGNILQVANHWRFGGEAGQPLVGLFPKRSQGFAQSRPLNAGGFCVRLRCAFVQFLNYRA